VVIQAFCPALTSVVVDSFVARNPLLLLHSAVMRKFKKQKIHTKKQKIWNLKFGTFG
jgi:hypothetical protein